VRDHVVVKIQNMHSVISDEGDREARESLG
jgi:hypothetical protein